MSIKADRSCCCFLGLLCLAFVVVFSDSSTFSEKRKGKETSKNQENVVKCSCKGLNEESEVLDESKLALVAEAADVCDLVTLLVDDGVSIETELQNKYMILEVGSPENSESVIAGDGER